MAYAWDDLACHRHPRSGPEAPEQLPFLLLADTGVDGVGRMQRASPAYCCHLSVVQYTVTDRRPCVTQSSSVFSLMFRIRCKKRAYDRGSHNAAIYLDQLITSWQSMSSRSLAGSSSWIAFLISRLRVDGLIVNESTNDTDHLVVLIASDVSSSYKKSKPIVFPDSYRFIMTVLSRIENAGDFFVAFILVWLSCTMSFILALPSLRSLIASSCRCSPTIGLYISYDTQTLTP